jgi:tRNA (guanine-N7-)-methyltransferase
MIPAERKAINPYVDLIEDYSQWVFTEEQARQLRGQWQKYVFKSDNPVHVEIGTGNGFHFAHYAKANPDIPLVGFEIKFKTVVQTIARAIKNGSQNTRMVKGDARNLSSYFADDKVEKIMIHFPDPWPKTRQQKNRLLSKDFFAEAFKVLAAGGRLEFKTDHYEYFRWATSQAGLSEFKMEFYTEDLHSSFISSYNYVTQFESLFIKKAQPIFFFSLKKPD